MTFSELVEDFTEVHLQNGALSATTPVTFLLTVGSTSKFAVDGKEQRTVVLTGSTASSITHTFDITATDSVSQTFKFSTTADGTHGGGAIFTTGVTYAANSVTIAVDSATPSPLYYYSVETSGMGGTVLIDNNNRGLAEDSTASTGTVYFLEVSSVCCFFMCVSGSALAFCADL